MITNFIKNVIRRIRLIFLKTYLLIIFPCVYLRYTFSATSTLQCNVILTSYPVRFNVLHWALLSILSQSKMSRVTVVLYVEDLSVLNFRLRTLLFIFKKIINVYESNSDLRSYKKILPILEGKLSTEILVLCDDDIFYPFYWLTLLLNKLKDNPNKVVGAAGHLQTVDLNGEVNKYNKWSKRILSSDSKNILLTGAGGIAFRREVVSKLSLNNYDFMEVCPNNDDLWIHYIVFRGVVKCTTKNISLCQLDLFDMHALYHLNGSGRLDREMMSLQSYLKNN